MEAQRTGSGWLWGPFALTALTAAVAVLTYWAADLEGLAIVASLPLLPAVYACVSRLRGRYVGGIDRVQEAVYVALCSAALSCWAVTSGGASWTTGAVLVGLLAGALAGWLSHSRWSLTKATVAAVSGGTAATVGLLAGPTRDPNPVRWVALWLVVTALAGVPWWQRQAMRRRHIASIDYEPLVAALAKHLRHAVTVVPGTLNVGEYGKYTLKVRLTDGQTFSQAHQCVPAVESELGWRPTSLTVERSALRRDEVTLIVVPENPADRPLPPAPLPSSIMEPAVIGHHDDGEPLAINVCTPQGAYHALIGGQTGSGKTRGLWTKMRAWTATNDAVFVFADLSGGSSSKLWAPCLLWSETEPERLGVMLEALANAAHARAAVLPDRGWESWVPSPSEPAIVFVIDEAQRGLASDWAASNALAYLVQVARKSAISIQVMAPEPTQDAAGLKPVIRKMMRHRESYLMPGTAVNWVFEGTPIADAASLVAEFEVAGQVLVSAPGVRAVPARTFDTDLPEAQAAARAHAGRRPALDALTAQAMAEVAPEVFGAAEGDTRQDGEQWTDNDDREVAKLSEYVDPDVTARIIEMSNAPTDPLGNPWPKEVEPDAATYAKATREDFDRLGQALATGNDGNGVTPVELVTATERSRSWVMKRLAEALREGWVLKLEKGRYVASEEFKRGLAVHTQSPHTP